MSNSHCSKSIDTFNENLGNDSSKEVSLWDDEESKHNPEYHTNNIIFEKDVLFVGCDEEVIVALFDEAEHEHNS